MPEPHLMSWTVSLPRLWGCGIWGSAVIAGASELPRSPVLMGWALHVAAVGASGPSRVFRSWQEAGDGQEAHRTAGLGEPACQGSSTASVRPAARAPARGPPLAGGAAALEGATPFQLLAGSALPPVVPPCLCLRQCGGGSRACSAWGVRARGAAGLSGTCSLTSGPVLGIRQSLATRTRPLTAAWATPPRPEHTLQSAGQEGPWRGGLGRHLTAREGRRPLLPLLSRTSPTPSEQHWERVGLGA